MLQEVRPVKVRLYIFCTLWFWSLHIGPVAWPYRKQFWFFSPWVFGMQCLQIWWDFLGIQICFSLVKYVLDLQCCLHAGEVFPYFVIHKFSLSFYQRMVFYCSLLCCAIFCSVTSLYHHWRNWYFPGGGGYSCEFLVGLCRTLLQILTPIQNKKCHSFIPVFRPGLQEIMS